MTEDKDDRCDDRSDIEEFIKENRDILENLIRREKEEVEDLYIRGKDRVRNHVERTKHESKDSMRQVVNAVMDPDIQAHFMNAGFDFILGINALMRAMPQPRFMKESEFEEEVTTPKKRHSPESIEIETPEEESSSKTTLLSRMKSTNVKGKE